MSNLPAYLHTLSVRYPPKSPSPLNHVVPCFLGIPPNMLFCLFFFIFMVPFFEARMSFPPINCKLCNYVLQCILGHVFLFGMNVL